MIFADPLGTADLHFHNRDAYPWLHKAWIPMLQAPLPSGYTQFSIAWDTGALWFAMNLKGPDGRWVSALD